MFMKYKLPVVSRARVDEKASAHTGRKFESHQCLWKYVDQKSWSALLAVKRSANAASETGNQCIQMKKHGTEAFTQTLKHTADLKKSPKL